MATGVFSAIHCPPFPATPIKAPIPITLAPVFSPNRTAFNILFKTASSFAASTCLESNGQTMKHPSIVAP
jgi:hypothetical protein